MSDEPDPLFYDADEEKKRVAEFVRGLNLPDDGLDIFGIVTGTLAVAAPGLGQPIREAIARSIAMKIKAVLSK